LEGAAQDISQPVFGPLTGRVPVHNGYGMMAEALLLSPDYRKSCIDRNREIES